MIIPLIKILRPYAGYILTALTIAVITVSSIPSLKTPIIHSGKIEIRLDYLFHIAEYGGLSFFAFLTFAEKKYNITFRKYFVITACLIIFCVADEFHQKLIPGRRFNINDIISNATGVFTALAFSVILFGKMNKLTSSGNQVL